MAKLLKQCLPSFVQAESQWKCTLLRDWPNIIGNLKDKVIIEKIEDDKILLGVFDSAWMHELYFLSDQLLSTINGTLDRPRIKQIRFKKIVRSKSCNNQVVSVQDKKPLPQIKLSIAQEQALENIRNSQLREVLYNFLVRCYREST